MANVLHRTTKEYQASVHTPDFDSGTWIINPDLSALGGIAVKYWKITGDVVSEMSQAEKDVVDASLLPDYKANRIAEINEEVRNYIESRYEAHRQRSFNILYSESTALGMTNRQAYIQSGVNWIDSCIEYFYDKRDGVNSASTLSGVDAVTLDFTSFDASDPVIHIENARDITD